MVTLSLCIVLGLLAGYVASQMLGRGRGRLLLDLVVGVAGALIAESLFVLRVGGVSRASGYLFWNVFVAIAGAVVLLGLKHAVLGSHPAHT